MESNCVPFLISSPFAPVARTARQERVWERNAEPSERSPAALLGQSRAKQSSFFLLEEKIGGARKKEIVKRILLGGERQRAAAGRISSAQNRFGFCHIIPPLKNHHRW